MPKVAENAKICEKLRKMPDFAENAKFCDKLRKMANFTIPQPPQLNGAYAGDAVGL